MNPLPACSLPAAFLTLVQVGGDKVVVPLRHDQLLAERAVVDEGLLGFGDDLEVGGDHEAGRLPPAPAGPHNALLPQRELHAVEGLKRRQTLSMFGGRGRFQVANAKSMGGREGGREGGKEGGNNGGTE